MPKHPVRTYRFDGQVYVVRDVEKAPLSEAEKAEAAMAYTAPEGKKLLKGGRVKRMPEPRDTAPPRYYQRKFGSDVESIKARLELWDEHPGMRMRDVLQATAPKSGFAATARVKAAGIPLLNANQKDIAAGLLKQKPVKHSLAKLLRYVKVKPCSMVGAKLMGDWAEHEWGIYALKYARGCVLVNHRGEQTHKVFPTIGECLSTIKAAGLEILK